MRDPEIRELTPECAFSEPGADGRTRRKLRGRVFKGRKLSGDQADWVVLPIVHDAVAVLRQVNNHPTHLFGWDRGGKAELMRGVPGRVNRFAAHCNMLWSEPGRQFIPDAGGSPWAFDARQFRRSLAWHIAHQPFGVVAGARQYQHAKVTVFEGYAGTSSSGFAAEVEAEQNIARLDYLENLYRDWNTGGPAAVQHAASTPSSPGSAPTSQTCQAPSPPRPGCAPCCSTCPSRCTPAYSVTASSSPAPLPASNAPRHPQQDGRCRC